VWLFLFGAVYFWGGQQQSPNPNVKTGGFLGLELHTA
jgi:hypothetical protein